MKRYDVWFCECGRIHIMEYENFDWMKDNCAHRQVIRVCTNCGAVYGQFLTRNYYEDIGEGFDINGFDITDKSIDTAIDTSYGMEYRFHFSKGIMVPMKKGGYADYHFKDGFVNSEYIRNVFNTTDITYAECKDPECTTVDTMRLIREVKDDDILTSISGYVVGIDWTGTKYERE